MFYHHEASDGQKAPQYFRLLPCPFLLILLPYFTHLNPTFTQVLHILTLPGSLHLESPLPTVPKTTLSVLINY